MRTDSVTLAGTTNYNPRFAPTNAKKGYVARLTGRAPGAVKFQREFLGAEVTLVEGDEGLYERQRGDKKGGYTRWYHVLLSHPEYGLIVSTDCESDVSKITKMLDDGYTIDEIVEPTDFRPSERVEGRMVFTVRVRTAAEIKRLRADASKPAATIAATVDVLRVPEASAQRIGSLPGCVALGCCDLGMATLPDGSTVTITWGRNLDAEQQAWFASHTDFRLIAVGDRAAELIIPERMAYALREILQA